MYVVETPYTRMLFKDSKASITMIDIDALTKLEHESQISVVLDDMYHLYTTTQMEAVKQLHGTILTKTPDHYNRDIHCLSVFQSRQQILADLFGAKRAINVFVGNRSHSYQHWFEYCLNAVQLNERSIIVDLEPNTILHQFAADSSMPPETLWTYHQGQLPSSNYIRSFQRSPSKMLSLAISAPEFADMTYTYFEGIIETFKQLYDVFYLCYMPKHPNELALMRTADELYTVDSAGSIIKISYDAWLNGS
ncbi:hypothetical protein KHM83_16265 [Fusibacter paucivorans]|uniref:Uncharacterized protein n=1 Tax=Fusibacter paucivorans TaxID=76009 RepID=A0ABS5PUY3_9FIRM|nr:hypothetical protein [Fusibacter paucivorans]MBS7528244.1 hypothetical protein [Fusibacter paucivorans]